MEAKNVSKWCREFKEQQTEIHNKERSGWPSLTDAVVEKIEDAVRQDTCVTLNELAALLPEVSQSSIHNIMPEKLHFQKVCARRIPRILTEDHK